MKNRSLLCRLAPVAVVVAVASGAAGTALADKIRHPTAVFAGLDKITGRIINFDVAAEETVQFGSLQITPRTCFTRPPTEAPQTTGFVEVEEVVASEDNKKIFSGWMFAASPGLHGVEHPVYDVWLTDCKGGSTVIKEVATLPVEDVLAPPRPGTIPRLPRPSQQPNRQARPAQPGLGGPLDPGPAGGFGAPPPAGVAQRPRTGPTPPGSIPTASAPVVRRAPTQSFFPTAAQPGESARDRQRFD